MSLKNLAFAFAGLAAFASAASAQTELTAGRRAQKVRVSAVATETVVRDGFAQTYVKVTASFSNACHVPRAEELIRVVDYKDSYGTLDLLLLEEVSRMCTAEFRPVTVTINLGGYTRPNDGAFQKVLVNGQEAVSAQP